MAIIDHVPTDVELFEWFTGSLGEYGSVARPILRYRSDLTIVTGQSADPTYGDVSMDSIDAACCRVCGSVVIQIMFAKHIRWHQRLGERPGDTD